MHQRLTHESKRIHREKKQILKSGMSVFINLVLATALNNIREQQFLCLTKQSRIRGRSGARRINAGSVHRSRSRGARRNFIFLSPRDTTTAYIHCFNLAGVNIRGAAAKKTNGKLIQTLGRKIKGRPPRARTTVATRYYDLIHPVYMRRCH